MQEEAFMGSVVTISSTYGTRANYIAKKVASALHLPFYDRAIPVVVAQKLAIDVGEALDADERAPSKFAKLINALAQLSFPLGGGDSDFDDSPMTFKEKTEEVMLEIADGNGGVILGRGGMIVLKDRPSVLSVRLDGPTEARIKQAMSNLGIDEATARAEEHDTRKARGAYVEAFYGCNPKNPELYHVMLDATAIPADTCVDIIVIAAHQRFALSHHSASVSPPSMTNAAPLT